MHFGDENIKKVTNLIQGNKLDEALFYVEEFIKKDLVDPNLYNIKGAILSRKGKSRQSRRRRTKGKLGHHCYGGNAVQCACLKCRSDRKTQEYRKGDGSNATTDR